VAVERWLGSIDDLANGTKAKIGFHTFPHTYSTLLKANAEDVKVVQELMRHANISTTMNIYTKALTSAKREAQSRVVDVLLDRSRNVVESAAEDAP
jgi:integrase